MRGAPSAAWKISLLLVLAGCARWTHATHSPGPEATSTRPATAAPALSASPKTAPIATSSPVRAPMTPAPSTAPPAAASPSAGAAATAAPQPAAKQVLVLPPDAAPRILAVAVSRTTVESGDRVSGNVVTSSNVASVEARIGGYAVRLAKVGVGRFALNYTVGPLPWFVHGNFMMNVIAKNARGEVATRAIPFTVR